MQRFCFNRYSKVVHNAEALCERAERISVGRWVILTFFPREGRLCRLCMGQARR